MGERPSDKKVNRVLAEHREGMSIRSIAKHQRMSPTTVAAILKRESAEVDA